MKNFQLHWNNPLFVLVSFLVIVRPQEAVGDCKNMIFLLEKHGHYLRHHSIQNLTDVTQDICQITCYMHKSCMSYNYCTRSATCEINDSDQYIHPDDLVRKAGSVYVGTENACSSNPCPGNATCQPNFYTQKYSCLCQPGFGGSYCTDIDECALNVHNCSINHTCINTAGSYDCICKPGYEAQGITCIDVDECQTGAHNCSAHSTCMNTEGSFECRCDDGYKMFDNNCTKIIGDYDITVYTANTLGAGTDAKVFIKLHGSHFKKETISSQVQLYGSFERRTVDKTPINGELLNMESLSKITISHDNTGSSPVWHLNKVIVDNKTRRMKYTFQCNCKIGKSFLGGTHPLSVDVEPTP